MQNTLNIMVCNKHCMYTFVNLYVHAMGAGRQTASDETQ